MHPRTGTMRLDDDDTTAWRQHGRVVGALRFPSQGSKFKPHPDRQLDLFLVVPSSSPHSQTSNKPKFC